MIQSGNHQPIPNEFKPIDLSKSVNFFVGILTSRRYISTKTMVVNKTLNNHVLSNIYTVAISVLFVDVHIFSWQTWRDPIWNGKRFVIEQGHNDPFEDIVFRTEAGQLEASQIRTGCQQDIERRILAYVLDSLTL